MKDFYNDIKPIRNILRRLNLWDVLHYLYAVRVSAKKTLVPEVIEFIYLNSIVYSPDYKVLKTKDKNKELRKLSKSSTHLYENINSLCINQDPWVYLHKAMLNQLKSGSDDYFRHLYRYYYIFSNATLSKHIELLIGMPYKDFVVCSNWLYSIFSMKSYCVEKSHFLQSKLHNTVFSIENVTQTLKILSISLEELSQSLKNDLKYDLNTFITHDYNHIKKPIFEKDKKLCCLFHEQLLNQFTSGIYYIAEIYKPKHHLNNTFGSIFEDYVGLILKTNKNPDQFKIIKEIVFNKNNSEYKTSDWIIETDNAIVFIECKTKRLQIGSKKIEDVLKSDLNAIADAVFQVYKVYSLYSNNEIPNLHFNSKKKLIPIIITLEEWFAGIPGFKEKVTELVKSKLSEAKLDKLFVENFEFHITSIASFETDIQVMSKVGFKEYFEMQAKGELHKGDFKYNPYFQDEINKIFITEPEKQINVQLVTRTYS